MPATTIDPLATPADLLIYFDWRWIGENILDTKPPTTATQAQVLASPVVARLLQLGTEKVAAAALVGGRYTFANLQGYGGELVKELVCALAMGKVLERRDRPAKDYEVLALAAARAEEYLEQLRRGDRIFGQVPGVPEAGVPQAPSVIPAPGFGPAPWSWQASRVFGVPGGCWPYGGW